MSTKTTTTASRLNAVARAADELRRGQPIVVSLADSALLVMAAESANTATLNQFDVLKSGDSFCLLSHHRATSLKIAPEDWNSVRIVRTSWMRAADLVAIADPTLDLSNPLKGPFTRLISDKPELDDAAIMLLKIARLLPTAIAAPIHTAPADILTVNSDAIVNYDPDLTNDLSEVARANVPLVDAEKTQLVSFRSRYGGPEHMAIVIGDPSTSEPVLTRIHSECFTGDLLGSLKCDCGEQLRGAIKIIADAGGGVVLYMAQEGRGIGLISKLKAYALQGDGYDTVDANTRLGFEVDERAFAPSANMLKELGYHSVRLMTNNPLKVAGLETAGIAITERVEHSFPANPHNEQYLAVKKSKTGHLL